MLVMMESSVGTTYELRSHSPLPVNPRVIDKADSWGELSTAASQVKGLVAVDSAAGTASLTFINVREAAEAPERSERLLLSDYKYRLKFAKYKDSAI